jgi:CelD/BcsL family acetyltransferase involved in cellulose biosynthesis
MSEANRRGRLLEVIETPQRFAGIAPEWERLADGSTPFACHAWLRAWWDAFAAGAAMRVVALWDSDRLVAGCPLELRAGRWRSMANVHSPLWEPVGEDCVALAEVVRSALALAGGRLLLDSLPGESRALAAARGAVRAERGGMLMAPRHVSPIVSTAGELAAWRIATRHRWGAPLERFRRKMIREHEARVEAVYVPEDLTAQLRAGFDVEASGWKGRAGTAIVSSPVTERFYTDVAAYAYARGELRLSRIVCDGEVVAFDLSLLRGGRLYLLKTGFDERYRRLAPGLVLRLSVIERCFELGLDAHELLGDESEWKLKFATSRRRHVEVELFGREPGPRAAYARRATSRAVRRRLRALARRGS